MSDEDRVVEEAERFLRSLRRPDLTYSWVKYVDAEMGDWVAVSTFGAEEEIGANDGPDPCPIRLRVANPDDDSEAEAYLSIEEAVEVVRILALAIQCAREFPQPETPEE